MSQNITSFYYPYLFEKYPTLRSIYYMFPIIIWIVGFIGNCLSLTVFMRKKLRNTSFGFYFIFLIISDTITLTIGPTRRFILAKYDFDLSVYSNFFCKSIVFSIYFFNAFSGWILAIASLDRAKSIMVVPILECTKKRFVQIFIVFLVAISLFAINLPIILYMDIHNSTILYSNNNNNNNNNNDNYTSKNRHHRNLICHKTSASDTAIIDIIISSISPFILMICSSLFILTKIFQMKYKLKNSSTNKFKSSHYPFALTLIIINSVFLFCNLPVCIMLLLITTNTIQQNYTNAYLMKLFNLLIYFHSALSFPLCFMSNKLFQRELSSIFISIKQNITKTKGRHTVSKLMTTN